MSDIDVKMVYESMDNMAKTFDKAADDIIDLMDAQAKMAEGMQNGALQGDGGEAFAEAITAVLLKSEAKLVGKLAELSADIKGAVEAKRGAVGTAAGRFGG